MTNQQWPARCARALRLLTLAAGTGLVTAGCTSIADTHPGAKDAVWSLPSKLGSSTRDAAIRKRAEADSFPTAAEKGM